jgi:uncharacterized membrane protein
VAHPSDAIPPRSPIDHALAALAVAGVVAGFALVVRAMPTLPDTVPTHFAIDGTADSWGSPGSLWTLPAVGAALTAMSLVLSAFPRLWNVPFAVTPANAAEQYRLVRGFLLQTTAAVAWLFVYISWGTIRAARGVAAGLPIWSTVGAVGVLGALTLLTFSRMRRAR